MLDDFDVVIIGAGPSGIAAIKQITQTSSLKVICFESRNEFGGIWGLESKKAGNSVIQFDPFGRPYFAETQLNSTPVYESLRTNVPKELMAYRGRPFLPNSATHFPFSHEVSHYLEQSSQDLNAYVQFNWQVQRVKYHQGGPSKTRRWVVQLIPSAPSTPDCHRQTHTRKVYCDFVLAANGRSNVPYVPFIPSLWTWPKQIVHSCVYRHPSDSIFQHKTVAVIGNGPSGYDIIRELAMLRENEGATALYKLYSVASHPPKIGWDFNDPNAPSWTKLIKTVPRFERIAKNKIHLADGQILEDVDVLCFATGYLYSFPFCQQSDTPWKNHALTQSPPIPESDRTHTTLEGFNQTSSHPIGGIRVHNLDQTQMFYYPDPSFAFLVIQVQVVPFPLAEYQARAIIARWSGRAKFDIFPMENDSEESKSVHALKPPADFDYQNRLLDLIGEGGDLETDESWGYVPKWKYHVREETPIKRRLELGY